jgi:hypothetical protein
MATNLGGRNRLDFKPDPLAFEQFGVNWLASLPKHSMGLRGALACGASTPISPVVSGCSSCRVSLAPGYSIRNGLAIAQD